MSAWAAGVAYNVGVIVTYSGHTYTCLQSHTSLLGWEPVSTPALWRLN
ncbi:carbohydrate-binding protein [Paenibacillus sp. 19GGS1-52]